MKDKEKKGEIELKEVTKVALSEDVKGKKPHCFTLFTPKRDYMISTASSSDTNSWVQEVLNDLCLDCRGVFQRLVRILKTST